jgi:hypothetical protein
LFLSMYSLIIFCTQKSEDQWQLVIENTVFLIFICYYSLIFFKETYKWYKTEINQRTGKLLYISEWRTLNKTVCKINHIHIGIPIFMFDILVFQLRYRHWKNNFKCNCVISMTLIKNVQCMKRVIQYTPCI